MKTPIAPAHRRGEQRGIADVSAHSLDLRAAQPALVGFGGIIATSSGAALLADATEAARRPVRFGQQVALGTSAAFLSSAIAGALASPVATLFGAHPADALVLRALVASGGAIAALSLIPVLAIRAVPVGGETLAAPTRNVAGEVIAAMGLAGPVSRHTVC